MKRETEWNVLSRFVLPGLAVLCCLFMVVSCAIVHRATMLGYLSLFAIDLLIATVILFRQKTRKA